MNFPESAHAHRWLDGLEGIEIGGSAHNAFGLATRNVDTTAALDTPFKLAEVRTCGEAMPVDIVADGAKLPLGDKSVDFVISSHVLEHFHNPVAALEEWERVARHLIYAILPQRDALESDKGYPLTGMNEIAWRDDNHMSQTDCDCPAGVHCTRWTSDTFRTFCKEFGFNLIDVLDPDDKAGNGFAVVIKVCPLRCKHGA